MKLFLFAVVCVLFSYTPHESKGVLEVTFYKDGKRVFQMEGLREWSTEIPIKTVHENYKIYCDSVSIKIIWYNENQKANTP